MTEPSSTQPDGLHFAANYFAAWIDVLGIQDPLQSVGGPYSSAAEFQRGAEAMRAPIQNIHTLRLSLAKMCEIVRADVKIVPAYAKLNLRMYGFADTIVLYYAFGGPSSGDGPIMLGVPPGLAMISLFMLESLAHGIPLRGAAEVGMGMEVEPGELSGRVMQSCHEMESKYASTVRIVIGPVLLAMIDQGKVLPESASKLYLAERSLSATVVSFIKRDPTDGLFVLDYLTVAEKIAGSTKDFAETARMALVFLLQQEEFWSRAMRLERAEKYGAAIRYFDSCGFTLDRLVNAAQ